MSTKKGNLAAALSSLDRRPSTPAPTETAEPTKPVAPVAHKPVPAPEGQGGASSIPPSRRGKKALTGYFDPEVLKQLKVLAVSEDKTMQGLMTEAINDLFKKYGKPHIA